MNNLTIQEDHKELKSIIKRSVIAMFLSLLIAIPLAFVETQLLFLEGIMDKVHKYLFKDWDVLIYVAILITLDTFLGMYTVWKVRKREGPDAPELSSRGFSKLGDKLIVYGTLFIVGHILQSFQINGEEVSVLDNFNYGAVLFIMVREVWSMLEKFKKLGIKLPPWLLSILSLKKYFEPEKNQAVSEKDSETENKER